MAVNQYRKHNEHYCINIRIARGSAFSIDAVAPRGALDVTSE